MLMTDLTIATIETEFSEISKIM